MPETKITDVRVPLPWEEAAPLVAVAKEKAARQFLAIWRANHSRSDLELRWGEEIEYFLVDLAGGGAKASICADEVLRRLGASTGDGGDPTSSAGWRTEFGNMMVEGVTHPPFTWSIEEVLKIEPSLAWRRRELERMVKEVGGSDVRVVTLAAFPLLGVPGGISRPSQPGASDAAPFEPAPDGKVSQSVLCPDEAASPHPRYQAFIANYRKRKGCKVGAFIPREGLPAEKRLRSDEVTRLPFELASRGSRERDPLPGHIYMDAQAFGACQCCTQATFLVHDLDEARHLTDQFLVLAPLFLALTAATPFLRGLVADTDTRWETFQQCWDDRREEELSTIRNSRTSPNDLFISARLDLPPPLDGAGQPQLQPRGVNDVAVPVHSPTVQQLLGGADGSSSGEICPDPLLVQHVAHLLARDPLMIFSDRLDIDDQKEADHWEQLQGTNWGNVRFKPPPADGSIGWRVEFRSPEVQLTDFENAATVAVIRLLAEVIVEERWDLLIPVSLCDENDGASSARDAASKASFWFRERRGGDAVGEASKASFWFRERRGGDAVGEARSFPAPRLPGAGADGDAAATAGAVRKTLADILSGADGIFVRCRCWLDGRVEAGQCTPEARGRLEEYMLLFERRASGQLPTPAAFLRTRLQRHAAYLGDGIVPEAFVHDLCTFAAEVNQPGAAWPEELLGPKRPEAVASERNEQGAAI